MKRHTKRLPALLLAILLCLNLLPVTAGAAAATTVKVGGVELSSTTPYAVTDSSGNVTTAGASSTNWNIKFENGTLTLDGANITTPCSGDDGKTYGIYAVGDLTLVLENTSTVQSADTAFNYGVYINGSLTVSGSGSLTAGGSGENSYGVYVANAMTAESGTITGNNTSTDYYHYGDGIYVGNTLTVAGGTVTGSGKSSNYSKNGAGIRVSAGDLSVTSGSVEGTATGTYGNGIRMETGALTVSGSGSVEGTATGNLGDGIYVGTLTVRDSGSVTGTANGSKGEGIYVRRGDATVEGGSVTGTASIDGYHGIFVDFGALTVSGGSVTGTAYNKGRNGIHVNDALTVSSGSVTGTANGEKGSGIQVNELTVSAGSVEGTANGENGYGIWVNSGDITITNTPTVTATSRTAGYTVMIKDVYQLLVDGTRYEPSANATVFKVENGAVTEGGETWALDVWVNGEKISDGAGSTVECGDGTAKYDPDTGTLTLTDAAISAGHAINVSGSSVTCGIYAESDLTLVLEGTSTVKGTSGTAINIGVYVEGDLTVRGSGTLTTAETDMGICAEGAMTVESGTVISNGKNYGIFVDRLTVSGSGSVEGTATGSNSCGIRVDTDLTVTGGSVTGTSTGSNSCGIMVADVLEVSGGSVTGEGAKYGVYVSEGVLEVSGSGSVSGTATGSSSDGIRVKFYLAANGGTVNGTGKRAGICLEQGALEVEGGTVTGEGADYGVDVAQKTLTVSGSGSVSGTATGSEGEGIYVYSALTVSGSGTVTGTATGENGWGIDVYLGSLKVTGGSVTGKGDSTGIYTNSDLTVNAGTVTGTGENGWGIDTTTLNMTGGIVTGKGTEAAIVAYKQGDLTADDLISVPASNYVPSGYQAQTVVVQDFTYASFAETGKTLAYDLDAGTFTNAATEITLKAPGAVSFPQQFYASINFDPSYGYKSFGHVTKRSNEWMIYTETGDVAGRTIYGMESAGGAIFTVESDDNEEWMLRVYSSDLATSRTIGVVNRAIVDTAMDLSGEEPVLYGTYNQAFGDRAFSFICKISLTDGTTSNWLQVTGIPSTDIIYAMAFDEKGKLYAIGADAGDDGGPASLYTIDLSSGAATATEEGDIKENGRAIYTNYVQDLAYDYSTSTLYWMENKGNVLYTVDTESAAATKVGQVRFKKDISLKTYSLSAFCILDGVPATTGSKHRDP